MAMITGNREHNANQLWSLLLFPLVSLPGLPDLRDSLVIVSSDSRSVAAAGCRLMAPRFASCDDEDDAEVSKKLMVGGGGWPLRNGSQKALLGASGVTGRRRLLCPCPWPPACSRIRVIQALISSHWELRWWSKSWRLGKNILQKIHLYSIVC